MGCCSSSKPELDNGNQESNKSNASNASNRSGSTPSVNRIGSVTAFHQQLSTTDQQMIESKEYKARVSNARQMWEEKTKKPSLAPGGTNSGGRIRAGSTPVKVYNPKLKSKTDIQREWKYKQKDQKKETAKQKDKDKDKNKSNANQEREQVLSSSMSTTVELNQQQQQNDFANYNSNHSIRSFSRNSTNRDTYPASSPVTPKSRTSVKITITQHSMYNL